MKVLMIDNYDSFTYNLVQYVQDIIGQEITVKRNDEIQLSEIEAFDKIIISPGPGIPDNAGIIKEVIEKYSATKAILGVCLGMQAMAEVFGGQLINLSKVHHGVGDDIIIKKSHAIFNHIPTPIAVGRYHSWAMDDNSIPNELEVLSVTNDNCIMAISHKQFNVIGLQFHPESVLTPSGKQMIENWLNLDSNNTNQPIHKH